MTARQINIWRWLKMNKNFMQGVFVGVLLCVFWLISDIQSYNHDKIEQLKKDIVKIEQMKMKMEGVNYEKRR